MKSYSLHKILLILITLLLFAIPFFWLRPGEMDLGGDSTRLYFFQPMMYLKALFLYNIIPSGIGGDSLSYYAIPYLLVLGLLRLLFTPTILIGISNGLKLSVAFLSCYLIVKELLTNDRKNFDTWMIELSSISSGLFYIFSPIMVNSGWDRAILTHTQIFVYPLTFYLLLRYISSHRFQYMLVLLLFTFLFSFNFSFFAAPGFFSFFPFSLVFFYIYSVRVLLKKFPWKGIIVGTILFVLLQAFHILPHILSLLFFKSQYNAVFSEGGMITQGLDYFTAIAPSIKVSTSLFNLAQVRTIPWISLGSMFFPFVMICGLIFNRKEEKKRKSGSMLPIFIFFLITLFFVSANITATGFTIYKLLFYIPGFKMFRNFYGQWSTAYVFFYALLIGQCLAVFASGISRRFQYLLFILFFIVLVPGAYPLINGSMVNDVHFNSKSIKQNIRIDSDIDSLIQKIRQLPIDGKILSLPLTGPGYQVIAGKDGGAYIGPSMFSYLAGRNDFTGYAGMGPYGQKFIEFIRNKDFNSVNNMMAILNIKYIFYNSDPYIYDDNFPGYPYDLIRDYMPKTQEGYKKLIHNFPIDYPQSLTQGFFNLYPMQGNYLPHIYTTSNLLYTTFPDTLVFNSQLNQDVKNAVFDIKESKNTSDSAILEAVPDNPLSVLQDNYHLHHHEPFISLKLNDYLYPFVLVKEKFQLWRSRNNHNRYLDFSLYFLTKRILELQRWGELVPVTKNPLPPPKIDNLFSFDRYNSWEASLSRYESGIHILFDWMNTNKLTEGGLIVDKIKLNEQLNQHKNILYKLLQDSKKKESEVGYLQDEIIAMFTRLHALLDLKDNDPTAFQYTLQIPEMYDTNSYDVYIQYDHLDSQVNTLRDTTFIQLNADGQVIGQKLESKSSGLQRIGEMTLRKTGLIPFQVSIPIQSEIFQDAAWSSSGSSLKDKNIDSLVLLNIPGGNSGGLIRQVKNWAPKKQFVITFDYKTNGTNVIFRVFDQLLIDESGNNTTQHVYSDRSLSSDEWSKHQFVVSADPKSTSGYLQFLNNTKNSVATIDIRNLSIVEISYPKIFFVKRSVNTNNSFTEPTVEFSKINPTRYQIEVTNAKSPYVLMFLEAYDDQWKLIDVSRQQSGLFSKVMNIIGAFISKLPVVNNVDDVASKSIVAEYFNGTVKEGNNINSFLDQRNFTSWGKKSVSEKAHFRVNGYANAWIIKPEDMENRSSYTLIMEMTTQNYFYIFLGVSMVTLLGVIVSLIFLRNRKWTS